MSTFINMTGRVVGRLTVGEPVGFDDGGDRIWRCVCECGNTKDVLGRSLRSPRGTKSCGCLWRESTLAATKARLEKWASEGNPRAGQIKDLTGQIFGQLTALEPAGRDSRGGALWLCRCSCGTVKPVSGRNLISPQGTKSCGCARRQTLKERYADKSRDALVEPGMQVEKLTVQHLVGTHPRNGRIWHCACDCGGTRNVVAALLTSGRAKSCGCIKAGRKPKAKDVPKPAPAVVKAKTAPKPRSTIRPRPTITEPWKPRPPQKPMGEPAQRATGQHVTVDDKPRLGRYGVDPSEVTPLFSGLGIGRYITEDAAT